MSASPTSYWPHSDINPVGRSFGELLEWHLIVWGTRPYASPKQKGESWTFWRFAAAAHGKPTVDETGYPKTEADFDTEIKRVKRWRKGLRHPKDPAVKNRILSIIFGDNESLADWRNDLEAAWGRPLEMAPLTRLRASGAVGADDTVASSEVTPTSYANNRPVSKYVSDDDEFLANRLRPFFAGRDIDLKFIDDFVNRRMAGSEEGLLVITAPAGFGKSALAVHWLDRARSQSNRLIVSHICSMSNGVEQTQPRAIYRDIYRRLAEALNVPADADGGFSELRSLLLQSPLNSRELVIWLDGIDEASGDLDCFLPAILAKRICLIISARAHENTLPAYLTPWVEDERAKAHRPRIHPLGKLSSSDVHKLTSAVFEGRAEVPADLATRIFNASEQGYALFARNMAETALDSVRAGQEIDLGTAPESLKGYVASELLRLQRLSGWSADLLPLFSLLVIAKEAVILSDLPILIGRRIDPESLPYQFRR